MAVVLEPVAFVMDEPDLVAELCPLRVTPRPSGLRVSEPQVAPVVLFLFV